MAVKNDTVGFMGIPAYQESLGESYMNERQRAHIEKILLAWRQSPIAQAKKKSLTLNYEHATANANSLRKLKML